MSNCRPLVRKIRRVDPEYGSMSADVFPWRVLPHRNATFGRGFRTQELAFRWAEKLAVGQVIVVR